MRRIAIALVIAGCGRVGFDPLGGGDDNSAPDATTECVADGFCPPSCGAADPDCQTTCGDTQCVGNAGETCQSCASDCKTTANVCGNGACGAGEDGTTCFFDCGPVPWTWADDEAALVLAINNARTMGTSCSGGAVTTAPPLALDPVLHAAARDLAWEAAHLQLVGIDRCNGQSIVNYAVSAGANGFHIATSAATTQARLDNLLQGSCTSVMATNHTAAGIGIAVDQETPFVLLLR
jgi:hypothetical protein